MKLQNTLGRRLVDFAPLEPGHVRLYTCGPTVYNVVHIGNLLSSGKKETSHLVLGRQCYGGFLVIIQVRNEEIRILAQKWIDGACNIVPVIAY